MATLTVGFNRTQHQSNTIPDSAWENPVAGTYDGVATTYNLQNAPNDGTLFLYSKNGGFMVKGTDYSLSGKLVTVLTTPLADGDYLIAQYQF